MTDAGSEFQTDGAAHGKESFAKSVRVNVRLSSFSTTARKLLEWRLYYGRIRNTIPATEKIGSHLRRVSVVVRGVVCGLPGKGTDRRKCSKSRQMMSCEFSGKLQPEGGCYARVCA